MRPETYKSEFQPNKSETLDRHAADTSSTKVHVANLIDSDRGDVADKLNRYPSLDGCAENIPSYTADDTLSNAPFNGTMFLNTQVGIDANLVSAFG